MDNPAEPPTIGDIIGSPLVDWHHYILQHNLTPHGFETGRGNVGPTLTGIGSRDRKDILIEILDLLVKTPLQLTP